MRKNNRFFNKIFKYDYSGRNLKIFLFFLALLFLILIFWRQTSKLQKTLEEFFFWQITADSGISLLKSDISGFLPARKWEIEELKISAPAAISVEKTSSEKVLFRKNEDRRMPLASLTKLMTAQVILENPDKYNLSSFVEISEEAILKENSQPKIKAGDVFSVENLLYLMILESSNGAALALSEVIGTENFVNLMNEKAKTLGLKNTYFGNSTGLDPIIPGQRINYSTAEDLVKFTDYLLKNHKKILEISSQKDYTIYKQNGEAINLVNTNKLLQEIPGLLGGKTGWTVKARGNLLLVLHNPLRTGYLITIVLGSEDRFKEAKDIIVWTRKAYKWW